MTVVRRFLQPASLALLVLGFILGVAARQLILVFDAGTPTVLDVREVLVRVDSAEAVLETRQRLIRYVFGTPELPTDRPVASAENTFVVPMANGFESAVRVTPTDQPTDRLVLYHAGHAGLQDGDRAVIDRLVAEGSTVVAFDMPLIGSNDEPVDVVLPSIGTVTVSRHDHMPFLDPVTTGSPLRYFLEPVVVMLNELADRHSEVVMIGISGGGWTTTLLAALDTRIDRSYPVAGSLPLAIGFARDDAWGDWEQTETGLIEIADYSDLYVLGAHGRRELQVLNQFDPCCFAGDYRTLYEPQVQAALQSAGVGSFDVFLDTANTAHAIGSAGLEAILADLARPSR